MITPEQSKKLEEWSPYFVFKENEYGDEELVGLKKNTPKKIQKEFAKWYKETYPPVTVSDSDEVPNN